MSIAAESKYLSWYRTTVN